jgi:queuine/archaeosine tRNA-ribosyltransferase
VTFFLRLVRDMRVAIATGAFEAFQARVFARYAVSETLAEPESLTSE